MLVGNYAPGLLPRINTLLNLFYNNFLLPPMQKGTSLIGFSDDAIFTHNTDLLEMSAIMVLEIFSTWMKEHELQLAIENTEAIMLTKKLVINLKGYVLPVNRSLR